MTRFRPFVSALLALGLVILGGIVAVSASAHVPAVVADCDQLTVTMSSYNDSGVNRVVVTIDDDVVEDIEFGTTYTEVFDAPDKYAQYSYNVAVTAHDDPNGSEGWTQTFRGSSTPCQTPAQGHTPVNVCHATSSDTNPYVFITVDDDSVKFRGHLMHRDAPNKHWKSDGVFRGQVVKAGDPKPDLIGDYTDKAGTVHHYDGPITSKSDCGTLTPPIVEEPTGSFDQDCTEGGVQVTITGLDAGTYDNVTWTFSYGSQTVPDVTNGQHVLVQSGDELTLTWHSGESSGTAKSGSAKDCPPPTAEFGKIKVKKTMVGPAAGASTTFTVRVDCPGTAYDQDVVLSAGNNWVATTNNIPTGSVCSLTEVKVPNGWNPEGITPDTVTVGSGTPSQVSAVALNKRRTGRVAIHKTMVGDPVGASTEFTVYLDCDGTAYDRDVVLNAANQWTVVVRGIPSGIDCVVTEPTVPAGWDLTSIRPSGPFTIDSYDEIPVEVVNTRTTVIPPTPPTSTGVITVTKVLEGSVNGAETSFVFDVDCPGTAYDQTVTVAVANATTASGATGQIPSGLTCTVTERSTPNWAQKSVVPANGAVAVGSTVTFTNTRRTGALTIAKAVNPIAGNGVVVEFGDTLTYTLTVSATGSLTQAGVVVTDYVPGYDPARPGSAKTTYTTGTAACTGAGSCTVTGPDAAGLITWQLGDMAAGTTRQVTFQVTIDDVPGDQGETIAVDVLNAAAVRSTVTPSTPSNEVSTPVTEVLPVKQGHKPSVAPTTLPHTGAGLSVGAGLGLGGLLVLMGTMLLVISRPQHLGRHTA